MLKFQKQPRFLALPINNKGNFIVPLAFVQAFIITLSLAFFVPSGRLCTDAKVSKQHSNVQPRFITIKVLMFGVAFGFA